MNRSSRRACRSSANCATRRRPARARDPLPAAGRPGYDGRIIGRRSARALAASATRADRAGRVPGGRAGNGAHPAARRVGAGPRVRRSRALARARSRDLRLSVNMSSQQLEQDGFVERFLARSWSGDRARARQGGDHREPIMRDMDADRAEAARRWRRGPPHRDRRLRHRLFVAQLSAPVPGRTR